MIEITPEFWNDIVTQGNKPAAQFVAEAFPDEVDAQSSFVIGSAEGTMLFGGYDSSPTGQALRQRVEDRIKEFSQEAAPGAEAG
jgi:hypothetical protein